MGDEAKEQEEEEEGRTKSCSPVASGYEVCKRVPLNWVGVRIDEKGSTLGLVALSGLWVEISSSTSGGPPGRMSTLVPASAWLDADEALAIIGVVLTTPPCFSESFVVLPPTSLISGSKRAMEVDLKLAVVGPLLLRLPLVTSFGGDGATEVVQCAEWQGT